uniref:Uncharacterized protein n=1 Tax=Arundo donax TaxID=35708 RepID=A0A0A9AXY9_ARUDO
MVVNLSWDPISKRNATANLLCSFNFAF